MNERQSDRFDTTPPPHALVHLSFPDIEKEIARLPVMILPLGGCEPYGTMGTPGIASAVTQALAWELSRRHAILCAPTVPYGCSTPFMSFGGTGGVKPRTLTNILCDVVRMWFFQGVKSVVLVDGLFENQESVDLARGRLERSNPGCEVAVFAVQRDERVRAFTARSAPPGAELHRAEYGMLSMAVWLDPLLVPNALGEPPKSASVDTQRFRIWKKRGADPQQLRKFAPHCSCSEIAVSYRADFGEALFRYILGLLEETALRIIRRRNP